MGDGHLIDGLGSAASTVSDASERGRGGALECAEGALLHLKEGAPAGREGEGGMRRGRPG